MQRSGVRSDGCDIGWIERRLRQGLSCCGRCCCGCSSVRHRAHGCSALRYTCGYYWLHKEFSSLLNNGWAKYIGPGL
ncbi:hypothetical protein GDO81_005334 [Engystomops pustulosus]|uniref:Uncharacterized protein n=1 Tax=Engystomops pustulosus TaxID=76066 RepID=A0AAV7CQE0_ENGPU|nr:hypothetical protein GDO81_005334 [Engystomops pustulosus]